MNQEKPDLTVAGIIKKELADKNLVTPKHLSDIESKLSTGTISEQDWLLMAELSLENKGESNAEKN